MINISILTPKKHSKQKLTHFSSIFHCANYCEKFSRGNSMVNRREDMFSCLPDEVLGCIVSFLPNESALQTSLLSTRWRDLWNESLVRYGPIEDITAHVAGILDHFEELHPLKHPRRLRFHFGEGNALLAAIAGNNKLLLDFSTSKITELEKKNHGMQLKLNNENLTYQPFSSHFFVKSLYLKSVCNLTNNVVSSVVSNLQHLENLTIIECNGLESLCIEFESKLVKLNIWDCLQLKSLHLRTSKLKTFRYRGLLPWIWPEHHFNLVDSMLDFRLGPSHSNSRSEYFDPTLLTIKNSEILTLCEWTFKALIWPTISSISGNFIFYNLRDLWWIGNYNNGRYSSDSLVSFLKLCPALEQLYVTIDAESYCCQNFSSCMNKVSKYGELEHLKLIKFMGFRSEEDEISLAKDLIQLVKGKLPRIETSDGACLQCFGREVSCQKTEQSLSFMETETSLSMEIKPFCEFLKENGVNEWCAKHAHMDL